MPLSDIVNVTITRETTAVSRAGFGVVLIAGPNLNSQNRYELFTDLSSVADGVIGGSDSPEYRAAASLFGQNPRVPSLAIGKINGTTVITDDAGTYTAGSITATINGTPVVEPYDTDKDTTLGNLATSIAALADVTSAVYAAGAHTITITPVVGTPLSVAVDVSAITGTMTVALSTTATEDISDALDAIKDENNDFYGVMLTSRTVADVKEAMAWVEAERKIFGCASSDTDILSASDTTSLAYWAEANNYARSYVRYSGQADGSATDPYPEAGVFGTFMWRDPGSYTVKFKSPSGQTADNLTPTQSTNVRDKNAMTFEEIGGVDILREGQVGEGEFIDVIVFVDWLQARMTEDVYSRFVNLPKVPFTDEGIQLVAAEVKGRLQKGIDAGGLAADPAPVVTAPLAADVSVNDKANRLLPDITFTATLAGAIHAVEIQGTVSL